MLLASARVSPQASRALYESDKGVGRMSDGSNPCGGQAVTRGGAVEDSAEETHVCMAASNQHFRSFVAVEQNKVLRL